MGKLPQFTTMNVIDGQAGLVSYSSLIFYSLTIDNILNIVILLILAGVSINLVLGENGLIKIAQEASRGTNLAKFIEEVQMEITAEQTKNAGIEISTSGLKNVLDKYFDDVPESYMLNTEKELKAKSTYGSYEITLSDLYGNTIAENETTNCT